MSPAERDRTLAMAGVFQAIELVQQAATSGNIEETPAETVIGSIFATEPHDAADVFGGPDALSTGLHQLTQLDNHQLAAHQIQALRYVTTVLQLARRLRQREAARHALRAGLERAGDQSRMFGLMHHNVLASLAELYVATIGRLGPRVIVAGDAIHLRNPRVVARIRALLLGAVRSGVLWHQCHGGRWELVFQRGRLAANAREIRRA